MVVTRNKLTRRVTRSKSALYRVSKYTTVAPENLFFHIRWTSGAKVIAKSKNSNAEKTLKGVNYCVDEEVKLDIPDDDTMQKFSTCLQLD